MKRTGNLFPRILDRDNLRAAFARAFRGRRDREDARQFQDRLEENLAEMGEGLRQGTYPVGQYRQFMIRDPKERIITAPCFAERVLHHAVMNICEPVFDRGLIHDTYACRVGGGRDRALMRAMEFSQRFPYFLKLDIRKYFDSICHATLLTLLAKRFKDAELLALFRRIVESYRSATGHGLPIGALTSQHFANFYLGWFDRWVKEEKRFRGYVRYMDDMAIWAETASDLRELLAAARGRLTERLRLTFKDSPYINRSARGLDFLGSRVFPSHITLNRASRSRFRTQVKRLHRLHEAGEATEGDLQHRLGALVAWTRSPMDCNWKFRTRVLSRWPVSGREAPTG